MIERKNVAILFDYSYERPFRITNGILSLPGLREKCAFRSYPLNDINGEDLYTEDWKPDGMLVITDEKEAHMAWLKEVNVPIVNFIRTTDLYFPSVCTDGRNLVEAVIDHFGAIECETIIFTGTEDHPTAQEYLPIFEEICGMKGIEFSSFDFPEQLDANDAPKLGEIVPDFADKIGAEEGKVGVFCMHDQRARVVLDFVLKIGKKIPDEVAVLGCFDSVNARLSDPPLSSVMLADERQGEIAIEMLHALMTGKELVDRNVLLPVLGVRVRGSTVGDETNDIEVLRARNLIRERAAEGVTVDQIVDELDVSRSTFEKRFVALTGRSPAQEIRKVRLAVAKELLLKTSLPLTQIAPKVGFMDRRAFMVFFKREAGMTPGAFREAHQ